MASKKLSPQQIAALNPGQLTAYSLGTALAGLPPSHMNIPANQPLSPDLEMRGTGTLANPTTGPAPSLVDRARGAWQAFVTHARLANIARQGGDPNTPESQFYAANGFYPPALNFVPGQDAASQPALTQLQAASIRSRAGNGR